MQDGALVGAVRVATQARSFTAKFGRRRRVSQDDVLFGYRLQLFDLAGRIGVSASCRTFGIRHSRYYRWRRQVERHGLDMLRPRDRRRQQMPNQLPAMVEE